MKGRAAVVTADPDRDEVAATTLTRVLYVQAPGHPRASLPDRLQVLGYRTSMAADAADALRHLADAAFAVCLIDLAGGRSTLTTVRLVRVRHPALPVVGVLDPSAPAVAAEAVHSGLVDLLAWPFEPLELAAVVADIRDRTPSGIRTSGSESLVAFSPAMREVLARVRELAATRQTVCLIGARGTGKALVARALHQASAEADGPCVAVDCEDGAASELETTLFGAASPHDVEMVTEGSAFARARGGTLVLEHLSAAPSRVQTRLGSLLRDRELVVGRSGRPVDLNVRVVATLVSGASGDQDAPLRPECAARFTARIELPALRRRHEDVPMLATRILDQRAAACGGRTVRFSRAALELLAALPWPGNVPELEQLIEAVLAGTRRPVVQIEDVLQHVSLDGVHRVTGAQGLREAREQFERDWIEAALTRHQGRVGEAARALGIQRTNLYRKVRQLGIPKTLLSSHR